MKGLLHTSAFLKANFHKKCGLVTPGSLVNQVTLTEFPAQNRLVLLSDCAINVSPSIKKRCRSYRMQSPWPVSYTHLSQGLVSVSSSP